MGYRSREDWRWDPRRHRTPVNRSIDVSSSTQEDVEARERKIRAGAHVVPFGFSVREALCECEGAWGEVVIRSGLVVLGVIGVPGGRRRRNFTQS